ncbi:ketoacyl-ACP synthase III [Mucilaginibacter pocheonensis]|uniref:3-oxoacyl-[acyl-carrier-protein] synthase-3 n=1 Tax=Mucilaginibacter pocheonensis TaxID=398050 RepID=A0ABU1T4W5_9SPHI|nr:ketoacyl-ACP synthase III [Mucilaginibacter pocheonensis]MDR6940427.1 3-oxoacyl-[acyl-carrier-protein] synthase-3 [Mucilaginibacter pocheonensis]
MTAYIKAISYYLPEKELSNTELSALFPEWAVEKIANKIGINTRHIAADDEFASDMAIAAGQKLFTEHNIKPGDIDFVLYCTQSPDYFLPSTACIIQEKLNIPVKAGALDFNLGCSGYIYGLALAKGLIAGGIAKNILLLTSETYSKFIHPKDKGNRTIFGDAAAATLISTSGLAAIGGFELGTDGKGAENLIVKQGAVRYPQKNNDTLNDGYGNEQSPGNLYMDGLEIFAFTSREVPALITDTLEKNNLTRDDIGQFILHQANQYMLEHLRKKMGIEPERFYIYMARVGNTVSSSIPIALYEALKEKNLTSGDKWLLAGFGVGYSWGGTVITFN